ncbi:MAG: CobW family GTP-binding protein [Alistipes sp.]|nr:CobW family GTP-binding protein [Alistipes sp.]
MTKINVISGFLGAGKTTLIKKLISESFQGEKVVLIENEFGEIGIDGGFLKDAGIEITEMNSGCICCSLVGDFGTALADVITKFTPDRIIIEPSGVGKLSDVMKAVVDIAKKQPVELDSSITVADANKCKMYMKNFGEFFNNQIEYADTIVLSRTQSVSEPKLEEAVALLRTKNEKAAIITTPWDVLSGNIILQAMNSRNSLAEELMHEEEACPECGHHHHHDEDEHEHHHHHHDDEHEHEHHHHHDDEHEHEHHHHHDEDEHEHEHHHHHDEDEHHHHEGECGCEHHHEHGHHHHHADEIFTSWGKETPHKYSKDDLNTILEKLANSEEYGQILRAKGIVPSAEGTFLHFDLVPGEYEVREGQPDYTGKLCVIGSNLKEEELEVLFQLRG